MSADRVMMASELEQPPAAAALAPAAGDATPATLERAGAAARPAGLGLAAPVPAGLLLRKLQRRLAQRQPAAASGETLQRKAGNRPEVPGGSESAIAEHGFSGAPTALPFRGEMEAGFGRSFGDVKVHAGPAASAASAALGARAYSVGDRVAFGSDSPAREVVAHELAHTIQQSGGSAVRTFAAASPDHLEAEADAAAATVVAGGRAEIRLTTGGGEGVRRWAGSDHYAIGNLAGQKALTLFRTLYPDAEHGPASPSSPTTMERNVVHGGAAGPGGMTAKREQTLAVPTGERSAISVGEASRFGGDYASTPEGLKGRGQEGGAKANWNPLDWRATAEESAMVMTAATNSNHFYPINGLEWANHHGQAINLAAAGDMPGAMRQEGFAVHFLQDTFSSGHMAPRSLDSVPHLEGKTDYLAEDARQGLSRSKQWHDFFCMVPEGLPTSRGRFHGDNYMDGNDLEVVSNTVRDSLLEVMAAGQKQPLSLGVGGQIPRPDLGGILADPMVGPVWRLMQDSYRADFQAAQKSTRVGMKGTTGGGTTYDSRAVLDDIADNVMGSGPARPAAATLAEAVKEGRGQVVGALEGIHHFVTATWDQQRFLEQDDDLAPTSPGSPHYKLQELEGKFKLFSSALAASGRLHDALSGYASKASGPGRQQAELAIALVGELRRKVQGWLALVNDSASLFTFRAATINGYRGQIEAESQAGMARLRGMADLPPEGQGAAPPLVAQGPQ